MAQDIVDGRFLEGFNLESILLEMRQVIAEMAIPEVFKETNKKKISTTISRGNFVEGFKKWKESTSTLPSR